MGGQEEKSRRHVPLRVLRKRVRDSVEQGDRYVTELEPYSYAFRTDFDAFADGVAHSLRHTMVYRSDGGRFARSMVRLTGDLKLIHEAFKAVGTREGDPIRLQVIFVRRRDPAPPRRWMMSLRFRAPDWVDDADPIIVEPDPGRMQDRRCVAVERLLPMIAVQARTVAGAEGRHLRNLVEIASRQDCPAHVDMWYYRRTAVAVYMSWRTTDATRDSMTRHTQGRFPFDGSPGYAGGTILTAWRMYPFRDLVEKHAHVPPMKAAESATETLRYHVGQISQSLGDVERELSRSGPLRSVLSSVPFMDGPKKMYGKAVDFLKHLKSLLRDPNSPYYAFD